LLWYERDGDILQAFEPADKTGPDAMEYRRLLFMMNVAPLKKSLAFKAFVSINAPSTLLDISHHQKHAFIYT
jgi:hypothetical protein